MKKLNLDQYAALEAMAARQEREIARQAAAHAAERAELERIAPISAFTQTRKPISQSAQDEFLGRMRANGITQRSMNELHEGLYVHFQRFGEQDAPKSKFYAFSEDAAKWVEEVDCYEESDWWS